MQNIVLINNSGTAWLTKISMHFWSSSGNLFQVYVVCLSGMIYFGIYHVYWTNMIPRPIGQYGTVDITLTLNVLSTVDSTNTQSGLWLSVLSIPCIQGYR